ncbi:hypothetical protein Tco_0718572 [Tanacetum coccineum]
MDKLVVTQAVRSLDYVSDADISWKSNDDIHDVDENAQDDDVEAQTESEDDDDYLQSYVLTTTLIFTSSSDDEDSDNEVEGMDVEGAKSDEDCSYVEDQGYEAIAVVVAITEYDRNSRRALVDVGMKTRQYYVDTYGDTVTIKRPRDGADDDQEPSAGTDRGSKRRRSGKEPGIYSAQRIDNHESAGKTTTGSKTNKQSASQSTLESAHDVYSKRRIIAVTKVEIVEWQNYKHLDWITVRRDDDILYKFKEGDFHRLRIQDIEDIKVLSSKDEDVIHLYSDYQEDSYENKDKKNRLMRIDELHKFSDGTLDDVRTALNDRLKGIRMEYLPQTFWSQRDKVNARAMIQAIDKRLKTRRIMRSLERFVGGRPYGGDLRLLQRTI